MAALVHAISLPLAQEAAEEGKRIIIAMLLVGLTFIAVIALGELYDWRLRRKKAAKRGRRRAI